MPFLLAASLETGSTKAMAVALLAAGREAAKVQDTSAVEVEPEGVRDAQGRLTKAYNAALRDGLKPDQADFRCSSEDSKRKRRNQQTLSTLQNRIATVMAKLLAIGLYPLLSEMRGFAGLSESRGALLGILGICPYMGSTLHKFLGHLALLNVGPALWGAHARTWHRITVAWNPSGNPLLLLAIYVDATQDPYWTRRFAKSTKISRTNSVGPCLSRVFVNVGPGISLAVETFSGAVSLKRNLVPTLQRVEAAVGVGELGAMTIIDAEMGVARTLHELTSMDGRLFVSVWKGRCILGQDFMVLGEWQKFRGHDQLREGSLVLRGKGVPECTYRAVEMERAGSRHKHSTIFFTNATVDQLITVEVAQVYLSRWSNQENCFSNGRNGGGLERSHGYGGEYVTNVAILKALETAERRLSRAQTDTRDSMLKVIQLEKLLEREIPKSEVRGAPPPRVDQKPTCDSGRDISEFAEIRVWEDDGMPETHVSQLDDRAVLLHALEEARRKARDTEKVQKQAAQEYSRLLTMPREIYKRDVTRDNIVTALTMNVLMLTAYVLREYFGGLKLEYRTFIEAFMNLPVTVVETKRLIVFQIEANPRNPVRTDRLRKACQEVVRRKIRKDGKRLILQVVDLPGP